MPQHPRNLRRLLAQGLDWLGVELDATRNDALPAGEEGEVGAGSSRVRLFVIPTDEELMIARETVAVLAEHRRKTE